MFLHSLNGHLLPVEYTCGQGRLHISPFKDLREMFHLAGTAGGNDRDGDCFTDMLDQLNIKAAVGAVLVNAV